VQLKGSFALIDGDDLDWGEAGRNPAQMQSDLVERGADASKGRFVSHVVVLSAAQVLNERVTCRDDPSRSQSLEFRASVAAWL